MKILLVAVLLVFAGNAFAQKRSMPSGTPGEIKHNLLRIEHEIGRANLDCDYRYFDQVEADDFIFTDASGGVTNKQQDMAGEKDCHKTDGTYDGAAGAVAGC